MLVPSSYNYIAAFLTLNCPYRCSYCVNWDDRSYKEKSGEYWVDNLNRLETDLSVTLSGGEPTTHKDFYYIVNNCKHRLELLTNLSFDIDMFIASVDANVFNNDRSFAPIRASFHSDWMDLDKTIEKIRKLSAAGFRVALYCVETDTNREAIERMYKQDDIDFQTKPLLPSEPSDSVDVEGECRTRELIIGPDGSIFKCHRDMYKKEYPIGELGNITNIEYKFRKCNNAVDCHPCDSKIKRDRFGKPGYCAIDRSLK